MFLNDLKWKFLRPVRQSLVKTVVPNSQNKKTSKKCKKDNVVANFDPFFRNNSQSQRQSSWCHFLRVHLIWHFFLKTQKNHLFWVFRIYEENSENFSEIWDYKFLKKSWMAVKFNKILNLPIILFLHIRL